MASQKRKRWKKRKWPKTPWVLWGYRDKDRPWNRGKSKWVIHGRYETEQKALDKIEELKNSHWAGLYQDYKVCIDE